MHIERVIGCYYCIRASSPHLSWRDLFVLRLITLCVQTERRANLRGGTVFRKSAERQLNANLSEATWIDAKTCPSEAWQNCLISIFFTGDRVVLMGLQWERWGTESSPKLLQSDLEKSSGSAPCVSPDTVEVALRWIYFPQLNGRIYCNLEAMVWYICQSTFKMLWRLDQLLIGCFV